MWTFSNQHLPSGACSTGVYGSQSGENESTHIRRVRCFDFGFSFYIFISSRGGFGSRFFVLFSCASSAHLRRVNGNSENFRAIWIMPTRGGGGDCLCDAASQWSKSRPKWTQDMYEPLNRFGLPVWVACGTGPWSTTWTD